MAEDNDINKEISAWLESGSGQKTMTVLVVLGVVGFVVYFIMALFS